MHDATRNEAPTAHDCAGAYAVACPECDAAPGEPCVSGDICGPTVGRMSEPHPERVRAAEWEIDIRLAQEREDDIASREGRAPRLIATPDDARVVLACCGFLGALAAP